MKTITSNILLFLASLFFLAWSQAVSDVPLSIKSGSVKLSGGSTLHDWSASTSNISGTFEVDAGQFDKPVSEMTSLFKKTEVRIPVTSLHSGTKGLDENMYEALKSGQYSNIKYSLLESSVSGGNMWIKGNLTIAGVQKTIEMNVKINKDNNGNLKISGTKDLYMTDFGIEPPSVMFGTIKADNQVTISFNLTLGK